MASATFDDTSVAVQSDGSLGLGKRGQAPDQALRRGAELSFRVWAECPSYDEEPLPWRCVAAFCFLSECLDYIAYCQDRGVDVVFQSPTGCQTYKSTDRRAVHKGEPTAESVAQLACELAKV